MAWASDFLIVGRKLSKAPVFMALFRQVCEQAGILGPPFGTHCFRVGGLNALQDVGCGPAELMAFGRWASDVWRVYARRDHRRLAHWRLAA